ncbi:protein SDA1 homolog [Lates japonicus]|uniref:Protein SDA1 homolog n=1 Tax=Lates japonicus TaxID=270547 RepID=A0AAD3MJV6_LATJO|nr:protein SDA1 homolog [Lates japonicus]
MPVEERKAKAAAVSGSRLLTQDDFKKIRLVQMAKEVAPAPGKGQKKRGQRVTDGGVCQRRTKLNPCQHSNKEEEEENFMMMRHSQNA